MHFTDFRLELALERRVQVTPRSDEARTLPASREVHAQVKQMRGHNRPCIARICVSGMHRRGERREMSARRAARRRRSDFRVNSRGYAYPDDSVDGRKPILHRMSNIYQLQIRVTRPESSRCSSASRSKSYPVKWQNGLIEISPPCSDLMRSRRNAVDVMCPYRLTGPSPSSAPPQ